MSDLIKRQDAINICEKWRNRTNEHHDKNGWYIADTLLKAIKELPSADRPQGEWLYKDDDVFAGEYACSNCNRRAEVDLYGQWILSNYCPHCGARMKGADDE